MFAAGSTGVPPDFVSLHAASSVQASDATIRRRQAGDERLTTTGRVLKDIGRIIEVPAPRPPQSKAMGRRTRYAGHIAHRSSSPMPTRLSRKMRLGPVDTVT